MALPCGSCNNVLKTQPTQPCADSSVGDLRDFLFCPTWGKTMCRDHGPRPCAETMGRDSGLRPCTATTGRDPVCRRERPTLQHSDYHWCLISALLLRRPEVVLTEPQRTKLGEYQVLVNTGLKPGPRTNEKTWTNSTWVQQKVWLFLK